ncbi:glutamate--cysteine ligase [Eoetvoesiella caeni]|uniref:Glutamate--cysteine ligase n=1 Tax=Eoetvoesiella caeni TaxID=645616 RepID=A0A366HDK4_9BURK|nr:glutamate--cysteine ligase [Eoetvoesiella caeni]MCI2808947.1 glutamate--cysteine ligase [Eoetvoesiella caeni]NYT55552.1 glutamate--cysteine ligase [Eoetvoesiella caeni]RBP40107.1 glutamate-cysteine ligase [Eoetvoesiella caeni]
MTQRTQRHSILRSHLPVLAGIMRGIEKEGLRVDGHGMLAATKHPVALGSALTNPQITTDYSEALLELITGTHTSVPALLAELENVHRFVAGKLNNELIWNQSMPAHLPPEADIPIAWYGTSNTGMLKHVYRRGLAVRYGKAMQCIAGVHYNFSVPDNFWEILGTEGATPEEKRSKGYLALIRNFTRYSWLLMYLFGSSPAVSARFLEGTAHNLLALDDDTLYLPHATSLRMSDLGYNNKAQSDLQLCYNDIETFLKRVYDAVSTPWPPYEAMGTHRDGEWIQLNTNLLQIENEYYSSIRPKRTVERCERPATALAARGVQYIEVRCLDIDPTAPVGISAQTSYFMDAFLLFCAVEDSPYFPNNGFCRDSQDNFALVSKSGRQPGLALVNSNKPIALADWGREILERVLPYADLLDAAYGGQNHVQAVLAQSPKVADPENTPSAQALRHLRDERLSFHDYTLRQSRAHHEALRAQPLDNAIQQQFLAGVASSLQAQTDIEQSDTESFTEYVARYHAALKKPVAA